MKKYEMLYVLDATLSDESRDAIIAKFEDIVKNGGGNVEGSEKWGVKKLAYPIDYKSEGYYVLMTFECEPSEIKEIERVAGITENVMRRVITKL